MLLKEEKAAIIKEYGVHEGDTGSPEVQIALLTKRINVLTQHMKANKKDFSTRRGLIQMVERRRRHLLYLYKTDKSRYVEIVKRLGLRALSQDRAQQR